MEGKLIFSVLQESQEGPIGDDWKYWIEAKVFNGGLMGEGTISVAKHHLPSGTTQAPHGSPAAIEMPAGDISLPVKVKLTLEATEVDLFRNDCGRTSMDLRLDPPAQEGKFLVMEKDISVGVVQSPGITGNTSIFSLRVRLEFSA